jgi:hypothetical protein
VSEQRERFTEDELLALSALQHPFAGLSFVYSLLSLSS